jgi:hypothetical protein
MTEPTVVVAIAAALANVGAGMLLKLTLLKVAEAPNAPGDANAAVPPPQAVNKALVPVMAPARGSMGMPANICKTRRREVSGVGFMSNYFRFRKNDLQALS